MLIMAIKIEIAIMHLNNNSIASSTHWDYPTTTTQCHFYYPTLTSTPSNKKTSTYPKSN